MASDAMPARPSAAIMTALRLCRSARVPPSGASSAVGRSPATPASASVAAEDVVAVMCHITAKVAIWVDR